MKRVLLPVLLVVAAAVMSGCVYEYTEQDGYRMAVINEGFPVPKNAYEVKAEDCTTVIAKSAKYKLKGIGDEEGTPPEDYLEEIQRWGWTELEDKRVGNVHYFEKKGKIMSLIIGPNIFDVFEMSDELEL
ncbi:hypothetical protein QWT69_15250 [Sporosarcina oncorhynchi]|uniref:Lipoprotein n=1 Tax=Sporosarcina oncorhynchi TaxID=3056444 RepID=A0ABZ0L3S7_9BACL|nr:hypothetical protein [Sporosarcina sp. T2O-4]WOV87196.1 hypothetical protein QWT69_15250 [Sporosarcina sp. T2O-4]